MSYLTGWLACLALALALRLETVVSFVGLWSDVVVCGAHGKAYISLVSKAAIDVKLQNPTYMVLLLLRVLEDSKLLTRSS